VTVIDFDTEKISAQWPIPGGGSPDMGNVSVDGKWLWLSGRFDDVVYRIDTSNGAVTKINVGMEPHGLTDWPQPGSLLKPKRNFLPFWKRIGKTSMHTRRKSPLEPRGLLPWQRPASPNCPLVTGSRKCMTSYSTATAWSM
jgi:hypothetical protein